MAREGQEGKGALFEESQEGKQFFFEKKNQKTCVCCGWHPNPPIWTGCWMQLIKVFCFFSSEKKFFPA